MNRVVRRARLPFIVMFSSFAVSSLALILIPFLLYLPEKAEVVLSYVSAFLFWAGIIVGCVASKYIDTILLRYISREADNIDFDFQKYPGVITFSKKPLSLICYIILGIGICLMISDIIFHYVPQLVMFPVIAIVFFLFVMHCITDGKNYKFYKKIRKECLRSYELQE